ncbi:MAG: IS1 family transposase [Alphaproteobacteria bacterium]
MNRLTTRKRAEILGMLVEGNSIRAVSRMSVASKNTVVKLLADVGLACADYQDTALRNLTCKRVQLDEIWAFCGMKEANVPPEHKGELGYGDVWTYTAICADTKLVPCWLVGRRNAANTRAFVLDVASRMAGKLQLTTDGLFFYKEAVERAFGGDVDYAMLVKVYGDSPEAEKRYSPPTCVGARKDRMWGNPDPAHVSTSYAERQNLTMRMGMRRMTRLTNAFSRKVENLMHAVSLHFMYYNFGRIHQTLRVTPAMEAGISDHVWSLEEIVGLIGDTPN